MANQNATDVAIDSKCSKICEHPTALICAAENMKSDVVITSKNLEKDGFLHQLILPNQNGKTGKDDPKYDPLSNAGKAIRKIYELMMKLNHRLYRGQVYKKNENGKYFRSLWILWLADFLIP